MVESVPCGLPALGGLQCRDLGLHRVDPFSQRLHVDAHVPGTPLAIGSVGENSCDGCSVAAPTALDLVQAAAAEELNPLAELAVVGLGPQRQEGGPSLVGEAGE